MVIDKNFFKNFLNLVFLRVVSRVIPVLMSAYIIKNTGFRSFGKLEFAKILNYFFKLIIAYGYIYVIPSYFYDNLSDIKKKLPNVLGSMFFIRFLLTILCFFFLFVAIYVFNYFNLGVDSVVLFLFFPIAIFSGFFPICIYQGLGELHIVTVLNIVIKIIFYLTIPFYIKSENDIVYYPLVCSIFEFLRLVIAYFILFYFYGIRVSYPRVDIVKKQLIDGFSGFCFSFYMFFYSNFPVLFLRMSLGNVAVGIYKLGSNVLFLCQQVLEPFLQCFHPVIKRNFKEDIMSGFSLIVKILLFYLLLFLIFGCWCFIFSDRIIMFFCNNEFILQNREMFDSAVMILKMNVFIFFLTGLSSFIGLQVLCSLGYGYLYSLALCVGGTISVFFHFKLFERYNLLCPTVAVLVGEIAVFIIICILFLVTFVKSKNKK